MSKKDLNDIAKIERAIKEKYGEDAIKNPKSSWDQEKEEKYLKDLKTFHIDNTRNKVVKQENGFIIKDKTKQKSINRHCPICNNYSLSSKDDLYMSKFECCFNCYIQYIEGRESRWKSGWRPNH